MAWPPLRSGLAFGFCKVTYVMPDRSPYSGQRLPRRILEWSWWHMIVSGWSGTWQIPTMGFGVVALGQAVSAESWDQPCGKSINQSRLCNEGQEKLEIKVCVSFSDCQYVMCIVTGYYGKILHPDSTGQNKINFGFGSLPESAPCISSFGWFCSVSFPLINHNYVYTAFGEFYKFS